MRIPIDFAEQENTVSNIYINCVKQNLNVNVFNRSLPNQHN